MLRSVFIGYDNRLNRITQHWLSEHTELVGTVWISDRWKQTWRGRREFLLKRIARRGLLKAIDEAAFHPFYHAMIRRPESMRIADEAMEAYWKQGGAPLDGPHMYTPKANARSVIDYLKSLKPDAIFAHCLNEFFGKELREIPRLGTYIWHVGILPEYKGLYSPFWTMHNADFENFGYSLFRTNDKLDGGELFAQGRLSNVDVVRDNPYTIEHKAIIASLPDVGRFIESLERGTARPIERQHAASGYYSYPGMTDYIRQRRRVRRALDGKRRLQTRPASNEGDPIKTPLG